VLATQDGGESWVKQLDGNQAAAIEKAQAEIDLARTPGDAQAAHRLREAAGLVADGPDKPFMDVFFFDDRHGLIVGAYGLAFRTEDGGRSWASMMGQIDNPDGRNLYAIAAARDDVYIAGEQAALFKSSDGAKSFHRLPNPGKGTFFGIIAEPSGPVIAFGLRGALYRSVDGGVGWERIAMPPAGLTGGKRLSDGSIALVDEAGHLWRSTDSGKSFRAVAPAESTILSGLVEVAPGRLILAGEHGSIRTPLPFAGEEPSK
jgi:photosystem II stability/assembly factor-like uncharacterized protein